jgi:hypothetical protein
MYPPSLGDLDHAWLLTCQDELSTAAGAAVFALMTLEHQGIGLSRTATFALSPRRSPTFSPSEGS